MIAAIALYLALAFSLGWYYTFTYYGRTGWPMPTPDTCASLILYYFSVLNVATAGQAVHWLLTFPIAGLLWATSLWVSAAWFQQRKPEWSVLSFQFALTTVPMSIPGPVMAWIAGRTDVGFVWQHALAVALRHAWIEPAGWLTPLYFGLGLVALALQIFVYIRLFAKPSRSACLHFLVSAILLTLAICCVGALAAVPLRFCLE
ncbi:MAG: hypothetical protein HY706_09375 [Candidatus Hydrogenedentes bacterium]|nr:hypothetical protein [Candidatus Hydrogenedentota bacterium]